MAIAGVAEGHVVQVAGPTIEIQFPEAVMPRRTQQIEPFAAFKPLSRTLETCLNE